MSKDQILQSHTLMGTLHMAVEGRDSMMYDAMMLQPETPAHRYIHSEVYDVEMIPRPLGHSFQSRILRPYEGIIRGPGMVEDWADFTRQ